MKIYLDAMGGDNAPKAPAEEPGRRWSALKGWKSSWPGPLIRCGRRWTPPSRARTPRCAPASS